MLREWQKEMIRDVYDRLDERGLRQVRRVLWCMAKKNGKTAIIAALVLVHLAGPEAIEQAQIFSGANSKKQASLIYEMAAAMVRLDAQSPEPLGLGDMILPVPSKFRLVCHYFGSFYQSLSKSADVEEGASPTVWIYDELGRTKNTGLYDSLANATGAWAEPLGFIISVQARSPLMLMSQLVRFARRLIAGEESDPAWSVRLFEVPEDVDPFDEQYWHLANPALGDFKSIESIRDAAREAKRMPSRMSSFLNFQLNQQVDDRVETIHRKEDWIACGGAVDEEALRGQRCYGGLDLSRRIDLSALELLFPGDDGLKRVVSRIWTPAATVAERAQRDGVTYREWIKAGHLIAVEGNSIDFRIVAQEIAKLRGMFDFRELAFDPWKMDDLERALNEEGVDYWVADAETGEAKKGYQKDEAALCLIPFVQGFKTFSPAVDQMEIDVLDHVLRHGDNPVLTWAASNAVVMHDTSGNRKLAKQRAIARIDPYVALTQANGIASKPAEVEDSGSVWDEIAARDAAAAKAKQESEAA